jgi:hypothetical protein
MTKSIKFVYKYNANICDFFYIYAYFGRFVRNLTLFLEICIAYVRKNC